MNKQLPFFNWSLKKALATEPDSFAQARIRIMLTIVLFSLLKVLIVLGFTTVNGQWLQAIRAIVAAVLYTMLAKILLYKPSSFRVLAHIMMVSGILIISSNIFVYSHTINLVTVQFVFMLILGGFYTLGSRWGNTYSFLGTVPILLYLFLGHNNSLYLTSVTHQVSQLAFNIIVVLNFISIILAHYLFFKAFTTNVLEKEALNQKLRLAAEEANELAASKSSFLSTMSHELRTPLNSVIGITELLLDDKPEERQKENLRTLHLSALDLLSLINNVLDFNKNDSDKPSLEAMSFHLAALMRDKCAVLAIKAIDKHLNFRLDVDKELEHIFINSDPTRLSQVIYNLVSNAIKFTDSGSVTVSLKSLTKTATDVSVLFSVVDTGIGIPAGQHENIFELFTQAEPHITRKYGGTGLGLPIVRQILHLFNSSIQLQSNPGDGSTFSFAITFPIAAAPATEHKTIEESQSDFSKLKILVAEDNDVNRILVKKQMNRLHIEPVMVENGQLAYEACLAGYYDAIFMDLHMPILDGYETVQKIRALADPVKAQTYILAFTASVTEQQKILEQGFSDFLYKPVNMQDLREKLEKVISGKTKTLQGS